MMNQLKIALIATSLTMFAWAQGTPQSSTTPTQPSQQPAGQQAPGSTGQPSSAAAGNAAQAGASTTASNISGCMQNPWGYYEVTDSATNRKYYVHGAGNDLSQHANHVVQVKGMPDPNSAAGNATTFYALQVQDSGQTCGKAAASAANAPAAGQAGAAGTAGTAPSAAAGAQANPTPGTQTPTGTQPSTGGTVSTPQNTPGGTTPGTGQPTTSPNSSTPPHSTSMSQTSDSSASTASAAGTGGAAGAQGNTASSATPQSSTGGSSASAGTGQGQQSAEVENKGTPSAGTPSSAIGAPGGSSSSAAGETAQAQNGHNAFQGCLSGDVNNYELKANGKTYRLQGNTSALKELSGHQVEVTGEEFNGKAIQVNGARDLGSSCSGK
jgi:hypothetical protein